jgi:hypothetical protein
MMWELILKIIVHHTFGGTEDNKENHGTYLPVNRLNF